ncbi:MAG: sigma-70 family RNA polymerase sigma factor [Lapillicoccus sp.]
MHQLESELSGTSRRGDAMGDHAPQTAEEFAAWVRPHWSAMSGLARRLGDVHDWEDSLQEALGAAWRKRHQFDPERGAARSWLLAIVADQTRKSWRARRPVPVAAQEGPGVPAADGAAHVDLDRALATLTARQRLAVELHYYVGLPLAEIATVLGCAEGTVKSTLSDARARLRAVMGEDYR